MKRTGWILMLVCLCLLCFGCKEEEVTASGDSEYSYLGWTVTDGELYPGTVELDVPDVWNIMTCVEWKFNGNDYCRTCSRAYDAGSEEELLSLLENSNQTVLYPEYIPEGYTYSCGSVSCYLTKDFLESTEPVETRPCGVGTFSVYLLPDEILRNIAEYHVIYENEQGATIEISVFGMEEDAETLYDADLAGNSDYECKKLSLDNFTCGFTYEMQEDIGNCGEFFRTVEPWKQAVGDTLLDERTMLTMVCYIDVTDAGCDEIAKMAESMRE